MINTFIFHNLGSIRAIAGDWAPSVTLGILALTLWEAAVRGFNVPTWLLPAPSEIATEIAHSAPLLVKHSLITAQEVVIGFSIASTFGCVLAIAIVKSRVLECSLYPFLIASQTIPVITIAPLLLVWVGPEQTSKIIVVALISFFPIVVNLVDGLRSTDPEMVDMLRTLGAGERTVFTKLRFPMALPFLFSGLKIAAVVAIIGAVIGEWVGAQGGLGWLMKVSGPQFQTARVFASIAWLSCMAIALFSLVSLTERWVLRNYPKGRKSQ